MRILLIISLLAAGTFAQTGKCELPLEKSPAVAKLRLGLDHREIDRAIGDTTLITPIDVESDSGTYHPIRPGERGRRPRKYNVGVQSWTARTSALMPNSLKNIETLQIDFFQGKVYKVFAVYKDLGFAWESLGDIAKHLGETFGMPEQPWTFNGPAAHLNCGSFNVMAATPTGRNLGIVLVDLAAEKQVLNKLTAAALADDRKEGRTEEEKKKAFKP